MGAERRGYVPNLFRSFPYPASKMSTVHPRPHFMPLQLLETVLTVLLVAFAGPRQRQRSAAAVDRRSHHYLIMSTFHLYLGAS